jgi:hypothetical protein
MHEVLILTEYSCRHEHGNRSVLIVALRECSGLTIPLFPSPLALSLCWYLSERSPCDGPVGFIALERVRAALWRTAALLMCQKNIF